MKGINRINSSLKFKSRSEFLIKVRKCIFISYQSNDKIAAKKIADYILKSGIDVYFDEYDEDLKFSNQVNKQKSVTQSLCKGIDNSSYMLVLVSKTTVKSKWVPFEIGYGYDKTDLAVLTLKGIPLESLPEYIRTAKIIRDIDDLNQLISKINGINKRYLLENKFIKKWDSKSNPLRDDMDTIKLDSLLLNSLNN